MSVSKYQWPAIAQDLALLTLPQGPVTSPEQIKQTYGLTEKELKELLAVPEFQTMFKDEMAKLQSLGPNAGPAFKFSSLSQALSEKLWKTAVVSGTMDVKDMLKLLELLLKAAGLLNGPAPAAASNVTIQNVNATQVAPSLPLPRGLKKLDGLYEQRPAALPVG